MTTANLLDRITEVDVDGMVDEKNHVVYIGKATKMPDGTWQTLADVEGDLCRVECKIKITENP